MELRAGAADQLAGLPPCHAEQPEPPLVPVALPAVEAGVALLTRLHAAQVPHELGVCVPARDDVTVRVCEGTQDQALGLDHSVTTVVVMVAVGTNPSCVLMWRIAWFCSAFIVITTST